MTADYLWSKGEMIGGYSRWLGVGEPCVAQIKLAEDLVGVRYSSVASFPSVGWPEKMIGNLSSDSSLSRGGGETYLVQLQ